MLNISRTVFTIATFVLSFSSVQAEINLADRGGTLEYVEHTNQGPLGTCYAHASSAYLTSYMLKNNFFKPGDQLSPLYMATISKKSIWKTMTGAHSTVDGGHLCEPINRAVKNKYACALASYDDDYFKARFLSEEVMTLFSYYKYIRKLYYQQVRMGNYNQKDLSEIDSAQNRILTLLEPILDVIYQEEGSRPARADLVTMLKNNRTEVDLLKALLDRACTPFAIPKGIKCHERNVNSNSFLAFTEKAFAKTKPLPVLIGYCFGPFGKEGDYKGCYPHASLIIGARTTSSRHEYLIRNTWGTGSCNGVRSDLECKQGDFWVPAVELAKHVYTVGWIKE